jgi:hypothetical protein
MSDYSRPCALHSADEGKRPLLFDGHFEIFIAVGRSYPGRGLWIGFGAKIDSARSPPHGPQERLGEKL